MREATSENPIFDAAHGAGPLTQRDYWAPLLGSQTEPEELLQMLAARFPEFADPLLASFDFAQSPPLSVGDEMKILIPGYGNCTVRVVHQNERSITLRTLEDHLEAGRITFGAWRDEQGELIFKIRSRARVRSVPHFWTWAAVAKHGQKQLWVEFVRNVAQACDAVMLEEVYEETHEVSATLADLGELDTPTFIAK